MCDGDGNGGNPSDDVDDDLASKPLGSSKHCADTKLRQEKRLELWNTEERLGCILQFSLSISLP